MDKYRRKRAKTTTTSSEAEVSSIEWKSIKMTDEEEDLINRMHRLVKERWDLIAGRIPGRTAEEIERFWIMQHHKVFVEKRNGHSARNDS